MRKYSKKCFGSVEGQLTGVQVQAAWNWHRGSTINGIFGTRLAFCVLWNSDKHPGSNMGDYRHTEQMGPSKSPRRFDAIDIPRDEEPGFYYIPAVIMTSFLGNDTLPVPVGETRIACLSTRHPSIPTGDVFAQETTPHHTLPSLLSTSYCLSVLLYLVALL